MIFSSSDHDIVSFSLMSSYNNDFNAKNQMPKRNYAICNFELVNTNLFVHDWDSIFVNCISADDHWDAFLLVLSSLLDLACPSFLPRPTSNSSFHYPKSIRRLCAAKIEVWHKLKRDPNNSTLVDKYTSLSTLYRNAVNKFHFDRESAVLNSHNSSDFYKFIRRSLHKSISIPTISDSFGNPVTDPATKAEIFNKYFSSVFTVDDGILPHFSPRLTVPFHLLDTIYFSPGLILPKLLRLKNSFTNNPDTFPPIVLKSCTHALAEPLSVIFNVIFDRSEFPSSWLTSVVIPVFKKGKTNLSSN